MHPRRFHLTPQRLCLGAVSLISLMGFIAGLLLISAYRKGDAAIIAPMQYSQIIWATIFGYLLFGETIEVPTAIGAAIIISSGIYIALRESRLGAKSNTPVLRHTLARAHSRKLSDLAAAQKNAQGRISACKG